MWDDRNFGRDDGIRCECGGKTYLVDDQGHGLISYQCERCEEPIQVQYDCACCAEGDEDDDWWEMSDDDWRPAHG